MILCVLLVVLAVDRKQRRKDVDDEDDDDDDKDDSNDVAMLDEEKIFNEDNVDADNRSAIICIWQLQKKVLAAVRICMMDIVISALSAVPLSMTIYVVCCRNKLQVLG